MKCIIYVVLCLLLLPMITSKDDNTLPWYSVEDWEIEVCSKWGGTATSQQNAGTASGSSYMFMTTITLQGQKTLVTTATGNTTLYEAAWYFRPLNRQQQYSIVFIGTANNMKTVYKASASPETGDSNYYAEESTESFDKVRIIYETGTLTVPIMDT